MTVIMQTRSKTNGARTPAEKVDAIAEILGVSGDDYVTLREAFDDVALLVATTRHGALRSLSAREIAMCKEMRVDVIAYAANKARKSSVARKRGGR